MRIDCRAFSITGPQGTAVVVATKQGLLAQGRDDEDLVPVGGGTLQENGPPGILFGPGPTQKSFPPDPENVYRTRVIILLDKSGSMKDNGKLELVKEKIKTLIKGLKEKGINDIDYTLILYDSSTKPWVETRKPEELVDVIQKVLPGGGTNIASAIDEGIKVVDQNVQDEARNIIVLITDGHHEDSPIDNVFEQAGRLPGSDCAVYLIGVGVDYDLSVINRILYQAKFGGLTHIPQPIADKKDVFRDIIPEFIAQVRSAPDYPIISFNGSFRRVVNMNPTVRDVIEELCERELAEILRERGIELIGENHFPSHCGYQMYNYSVGFINGADLAAGKGKVILYVKPQGNSKQILEAREIDIEPFDQAILDPGERELIEKSLKFAEMEEVLRRRDPGSLRDFVQRQQNSLSSEEAELLRREQERLNGNDWSRVDEAASRESMSSFTSNFTGETMLYHGETTFRPSEPKAPLEVKPDQDIKGNEVDPNIVNEFSRLESLTAPGEIPTVPASSSSDAGLHSGIVHPLSADDKIGSLPMINGPQDVNPKAYGNPNNPIKFKITILSQIEQLKKSEFEISDKSTLSVGRARDRDIVLDNPLVSRNHCSFVRNGDKISIHDDGSTHGTFVNTVRINSSVELKSGDTVEIGPIQLRFERLT